MLESTQRLKYIQLFCKQKTNWPSVFKSLRNIKYKGVFIIEIAFNTICHVLSRVVIN